MERSTRKDSPSESNHIGWRNISDSTLGQNLEVFEEQLRCPICQDFYDNPQILKCGHSFCSLCIRKHLDSTINRDISAICPTCREKAELFDLRKNVVLSALGRQFQELRRPLYTSLLEHETSHGEANKESIGSFSKYHQIPGKAIATKLSQYHFHGANKEKVRKAIDDVCKGSAVKLRADGDKDVLERRLKELIHLINAQVGSDHPLTLDGAIKKVNDEEMSKSQSMNYNNYLGIEGINVSFSTNESRGYTNNVPFLL
jgi:hypothetical protein